LNIKDVLKNATVGPFQKDSQEGYPVAVLNNEKDLILCRANGLNQPQAKANAALIAHCVNHFEKLVAVLNEASDFINRNAYKWTDDEIKTVSLINQAIRDAEEVKGL
jgi:hypothetical protein